MYISIVSPQNKKPIDSQDIELICAGYNNTQNTSPSKAFELRNTGVAAAVNSIVTFYDELDIWFPEHLDILSKNAFEGLLLVTPKFMPLPINQLRRYFDNGEACPTGCIVVNKSFFFKMGGFDSTLLHSASWAFITKCIHLAPEKVKVINSASWQYVFNPNSIANTKLPAHKDVIKWRQQWAANL